MNNLCKLSNTTNFDIFTKKLGLEIEEKLIEKGINIDVNYSVPYKTAGYIIFCSYKENHMVEIIIEYKKEENSAIISKFSGIEVYNNDFLETKLFLPEDLRNAAEMYEGITNLLDKKFGNPKKGNRISIYKASLEEKL